MNSEITAYVECFFKESKQRENHRYNSWCLCYNAFQESFKDSKYDENLLTLNLAFYLASWGMYRGSSNLLQFDYKIHLKTIEILYEFRNCKIDETDKIMELCKKLKAYYNSKSISPTDTLISKIMLGTLGVTVAYDRYVKTALKSKNITPNLSSEGLNQILTFHKSNKNEIDNLSQKYQYPVLKIMDMYLFELGMKQS